MHIAELLINTKKNVIYKEMNIAYLVTFNPNPVIHQLEQSKTNQINMSTLINSFFYLFMKGPVTRKKKFNSLFIHLFNCESVININFDC